MAEPMPLRYTQAQLTERLSEGIEEVERLETAICAELPVESPYGVHACLREVAEEWAAGRRGMRTYPVANTYEAAFGQHLDEDVIKLLLALDAKVITFDDLIDRRRPSQREQICGAVVIAFSGPLELRSLPPEGADTIADELAAYWTVMSQVPLVERRLLEAITEAQSRDEILEATHEIYAYRARDVDAFVRVPMAIDGLAERDDWYLADLRAFRARYLLFEDFRHIRRDLQEGHTNPAIVMMQVLDEPDEVVSAIEALYEGFDYRGEDAVSELLGSMERRPEDLGRSVTESMRVLNNDLA